MSPRPVPSRHDTAARGFLDAAARLIDAALAPSREAMPPTLRRISYPAALEWMHVEDAIRVAQETGGAGLSRKAFHNRWASKDEFIRDAVIHAMLYRDDPTSNPSLRASHLAGVATADTVSEAIIQVTDGLLEALLAHPRSFLLLHVGPLLDQHPALRSAIVEDMLASRAPWYQGYGFLLTELGLTLRPGWTVERIGLALQAMLDGFVFRSRIQREELSAVRWEGASLFADTVVAFTLGMVDAEGSGKSSREAADTVVGRSRHL